jgi:hypothetical protein
MRKYYATLSEKDQQLYAWVEVLKLGIGGQVYIARILDCSEKTAHDGLAELAGLPDKPEYNATIRSQAVGESVMIITIWI